MVGEVGFAIPSILKTKDCTLFSILSFRRNRSFRKGLTHELTRLDISFLESNFPQHVYTRTLVDNRNHLAKGEGVMLYVVVVRLCATFPCFTRGLSIFWGTQQMRKFPSRRLSFPLTAVNYTLTKHFSLRAEYRGYVYKDADFGIRALNTDSWTHTVQPSAGIVFRF